MLQCLIFKVGILSIFALWLDSVVVPTSKMPKLDISDSASLHDANTEYKYYYTFYNLFTVLAWYFTEHILLIIAVYNTEQFFWANLKFTWCVGGRTYYDQNYYLAKCQMSKVQSYILTMCFQWLESECHVCSCIWRHEYSCTQSSSKYTSRSLPYYWLLTMLNHCILHKMGASRMFWLHL